MHKNLTMEQARQRLIKEKDICLIDVRTVEEYRNGHIKGSLNIPLEDIGDILDIAEHMDTKIFLYCRTGRRSGIAGYTLSSMGYTNVWNIGGIRDWPCELTGC